ncbi:hypothetical protein Tco_0040887 [Tanacetum coccineum]
MNGLRTDDAPDLYMQQFWHTVTYDLTAKTYFITLDDQIFRVNADLLREALQITPKDFNLLFVQPLPEGEFISFIIQLEYNDSLTQVSKMTINNISIGNSQGENVDFTELIWEDFKFQIKSRKTSKQKKELLPFPIFIKLVIKHILSLNNHISKRLESYQHVIKIDASLGNLKLTNKGAKDPVFRMPILMVMLSEEIKAFEDYLNYLAKCTGTQPIKVKGKGKGLLTKKCVEVVVKTVRIPKKRRSETIIKETGQSEEVADTVDLEETEDDEEEPQLTRRRQTSVVIGRTVHTESNEGTLDHSKMLKGVVTMS